MGGTRGRCRFGTGRHWRYGRRRRRSWQRWRSLIGQRVKRNQPRTTHHATQRDPLRERRREREHRELACTAPAVPAVSAAPSLSAAPPAAPFAAAPLPTAPLVPVAAAPLAALATAPAIPRLANALASDAALGCSASAACSIRSIDSGAPSSVQRLSSVMAPVATAHRAPKASPLGVQELDRGHVAFPRARHDHIEPPRALTRQRFPVAREAPRHRSPKHRAIRALRKAPIHVFMHWGCSATPKCLAAAQALATRSRHALLTNVLLVASSLVRHPLARLRAR